MVYSFVKMVVDNFSKINNTTFLYLNLSSFIKLDPGCMDEPQISYEILTFNIHNHKLSFPKLFVVRNLIVVCFTLSHFENSSVTFKNDFYIFKFFGVYTFKF